MFPSLIREGQVVKSPAGKAYVVLGMFQGDVIVEDEKGRKLIFPPSALKHVETPRDAGPILEALE